MLDLRQILTPEAHALVKDVSFVGSVMIQMLNTPLLGAQFTCFTGTKVRKLTQKRCAGRVVLRVDCLAGIAR
jgi:hypothetical protein